MTGTYSKGGDNGHGPVDPDWHNTHNFFFIDSLSYDGVLHIKVGLFGVDDEELRAIGIRTTASHAHNSTNIVLLGKN